MTMSTTNQVRRLNALVEEFDRVTAYEFDRETSAISIILIASCWSMGRRSLAGDLARAFAAVKAEGEA